MRDGVDDGGRAAHRVAAGEDAGNRRGQSVGIDADRPVAPAREAVRWNLDLLADGHDDAVGGQGVLAAGHGPGARPSAGIDWPRRHADARDRVLLDAHGRGQECDRDTFLDGGGNLVRMRRHVGARAAIDLHHVGAEAAADPRRVDRRIAAANHDDALTAQAWRVARVDRGQEREPVDHARPLLARDAQRHPAPGTGGDEGGIEPLPEQVLDRGDPLARADLHAGIGDEAKVGLHHVIGQPVGGDAVTQHATGLVQRLENRHRVPEQREEPGSGQAARTRADDRHAHAGAGEGGGRSAPLGAALGGDALQGADGHRRVELAARAPRLAGMEARMAAHQRERDAVADDVERRAELAEADMADIARHIDAGRAGTRTGGRFRGCRAIHR